MPKHQSELPYIVAIVRAMEANDVHVLGDLDAGPLGITRHAPLLFTHFVALQVDKAKAVNVTFRCYVDLNRADLLARDQMVDLGIFGGPFKRVDSRTLDITRERELELVQVRIGFHSEAIELDLELGWQHGNV